MSEKSELVIRIKRRLGYPMIKLEINDDQIEDNIEYARTKFIKYAFGNATQEVFFTQMLSAGQHLYDMPGGVVEVISYTADAVNTGGINTLFTLENYFYSQGMFSLLNPASNNGYTLIGYHIARDFLETLDRYTPDAYNFKYHKKANKLEIQPPPPSGNALVIGDYTYDSPGFVLIKAVMISGSTLEDDWEDLDSVDNELYESQWVEDYALAMTKHTLGLIRRKFANFSALGNQGTSLDGDSLVSEAREEMEKLSDDLDKKETYKGYGIYMG
jgi:hypothetical protein